MRLKQRWFFRLGHQVISVDLPRTTHTALQSWGRACYLDLQDFPPQQMIQDIPQHT